MNIDDEDLITNLRTLEDESLGSGPSPDSQGRAWQTVLRHGRRARLARRARTAGAAAVAVVVAGAGLSVTGFGPAGGTSQTAHVGTVAHVLNTAAENTDNAKPGPGEYTHITTERWRRTGAPVKAHDTSVPVQERAFIHFRKKTREEVWIPANAQGTMYRSVTGPLATEFRSAADKRYVMNHYPDRFEPNTRYFAGPSHNGKQTGRTMHSFEPGHPAIATGDQSSKDGQRTTIEDKPATWYLPTPAFLDSLPRDPEALLDALATGHGDSAVMFNHSRADTQFRHLAGVLTSGLVPSDLRAALYDAALKIPGVTVTEETTTFNGQPGIAVGRVSSTGHIRQEIIFSKSDYQYIGQRQVLVEPGGRDELTLPANLHAPKGTVFYSAAVTTNITDKPKFAIPK
ncbi:hypothetical protein DFQ14_102586 [Halopolyspora algeriensis]|uniref:CU044_5270 family protein n=1 Tax=Halopolyspora algeriensis TaxID=1500506 RepID=A0A368VWQ2_9ACTN|nr:CU044_5270 family protein [Halopolyspora algeriensis]RCW46283.1 hypothetical protein DFQ14_102586 [Halopolyspora algeriensis]TQM55685.1 hypothetical protein FHU43_0460 [Halopolyspora algeriensis]